MSRVVPTSQIKQWSNEQGSLYCVNSDSAIKCRLMLRRYIIYLDFQVSYKQQQTEKKKKEKKRKGGGPHKIQKQINHNNIAHMTSLNNPKFCFF